MFKRETNREIETVETMKLAVVSLRKLSLASCF